VAQLLTTGILRTWSLSLSGISLTRVGVGFRTKYSLRIACSARNFAKDGSINERGQIGEGVDPKPSCGRTTGVAILLLDRFDESFNNGFYLAVRLGLFNDVGHYFSPESVLNGDQAYFFDEQIIKRNRPNIFTKGNRGEGRDDAKGNVMLYALPLCICNDTRFKRNLGAKFSGDLGILLNGEARTDLITVDLCGRGTLFIENITYDPIEFAILIFHGGWFENHANIPFMGDVDEGCK
jgi:hypothetical protein